MQLEQSEAGNTLDANTVLNFLTLNPEFFNQHADLLPRLRIPHHTGAAVSLIEKQVSVLRGKCTSLESNLHDLIAVARDNELLHQRLHQLVQDIISANSLNDVIALTRASLLSNFNADDVRLVLFGKTADKLGEALPDHHVLQASEKTIALFKDNFKQRDTFCGQLNEKQTAVLFGSDSQNDIASAAIIPLIHKKELGLVVLVSKDESRFSSGKGVIFLNQLGEVLSRRVHALL